MTNIIVLNLIIFKSQVQYDIINTFQLNEITKTMYFFGFEKLIYNFININRYVFSKLVYCTI